MTNEHDVQERIRKEISDNDVVLYMRGSKAIPACGHSAVVVEILRRVGLGQYKSVNADEESELWDGLEAYHQWPTMPQLFVKGEFVGGRDIVQEMYESGELAVLLADKGLLKAA